MFKRLRDFFRPQQPPRLPAVKPGTRYYAIGDIHGRLDLFEAMIAAIEEDDRTAASADTRIVLLGDLVDRGPDSAGVIARARSWQQNRKVRILAGNHEEMFLAAFEKPEALRHFLKHGGRETLISYGLSKKQLATLPLEEIFERLPALVPQAERDYIAAFEPMVRAGDYVFVHAGIDPARPLAEQKRSDLLWIRDRFLNHAGPLEKVVVHGHTIFDRVMDCGNRIGIDTGAFRSGVLTALVLESDQRRIIQACASNGEPVQIFHGDRAI
ncbi:MAG: Calcineurin-like phosphoesterase [Porphyrobacter sp. HL-46]|nr:MAG: Calcineurin-like phosphoesterase [Porphyrobacter sp. HL-46]